MASKKSRKTNSEENNHKEITVAKITTAGVIITAIIGLLGVLLTNYFNRPLQTATSVDASQETVQTPTVALNLIKGPLNFEFIHDKAAFVQWQFAEVLLEDFVAETEFTNPYSAGKNLWNAALFFRDGYRVWVSSDGFWGYGYFDEKSDWVGYDATLPNGILNLDGNEQNHMKIIVNGESGCFYVNEKFIGHMDLDDLQQVGDIGVGISESEAKIDGEVTAFENFNIYSSQNIRCQ